MNRISVYGAFGFVLGEFCRQFPEEVIRIPKHEVAPQTPQILYGISTTDNYNVYENVTVDIETNLIHLVEVLDACHKAYGKEFEFVFISSWFVYGQQISSPNFKLLETSTCNPTGFYSITKFAAERLLASYCTTFGIKYKILRLANVLGYRDNKVSKKKNALQFLIDAIVHNEDVELYDGGNFYRDYIDVRDCARAIKFAMGGDELVYNISNGVSHKFRDLIDFAVKYSGSTSNVWDKQEIPEFHSVVQAKDVFIDNGRLAKLGYAPEFTIENTIMKIIDEYKER